MSRAISKDDGKSLIQVELWASVRPMIGQKHVTMCWNCS
jgi:hypothetical protein